jgi:hypothetical protein
MRPKKRRCTWSTSCLALEQEVQTRRFAVEAGRAEHKVKLGTLDDDLARRRTKTANMENATLALVKNLPAAVNGLKVNELNLGDDVVHRLVTGITSLFTPKDA